MGCFGTHEFREIGAPWLWKHVLRVWKPVNLRAFRVRLDFRFRTPASARYPRNLVFGHTWAPKVCNTMALWGTFQGFGPLLYILWGRGKPLRRTCVLLARDPAKHFGGCPSNLGIRQETLPHLPIALSWGTFLQF